jgi:hypothetical protein
MFNPDTSTIGAQLSRSAETAAQKFAVELVDAQVRQSADIETTIAALTREQHGGLIVAPDGFTQNRWSSISRPATNCPRSIPTAITPPTAA